MSIRTASFTIALILVPTVYADIVVNANSGTNKILTAGGADVPLGGSLRAGTFSSEGGLASVNSFASLNAIFTPLGEGITNAGTLVQPGGGPILTITIQPGTFFGSFEGVGATYIPSGTQLYLWAFNSANPSTATEWGIFKAPSWVVPNDLGSVTLSLSSPNVLALRGSADGNNFRLDPVPEPSAVGLLLAGALVAAASRQKRTVRTISLRT